MTSVEDGQVKRSQRPVTGFVTKVGMVLAVLLAVRYFFWRVTDTVNPSAMWFFALFLGAELVGFGEVFLFYVTTWKRRRRVAPPAPAGRTVDVFIPTYNEPVGLLRDTVVSAVSMRYPHTTWVLDDGNRPEVAALARELGCEYLARTDRVHAKAGNLNHALTHSSGEFLVTLDADHVPMPDLIEQLLGFFEDPKVALVQTNQDFYNLDSFQHETDWEARSAWQQQELFFNVIEPGKDGLKAAIYCGSPAIIRRKALDDVGGFARETVTEDMHTGLRMQKRGWEVVFHNRTVARGLAPQTFIAYNTQWRRWGFGAMQVLRLEKPLTAPGLTFGQRIAYFSSFYFYWTSYQKLIYLLVPAFCVATAVFPLLAEPELYLSYFLPYLVLNLAVTASLQGGFGSFVRTERYNLIKLGAMLRSVAGLVQRRATFTVTPKTQSDAVPWLRMLHYTSLLALLILTVVVGLVRTYLASGTLEAWAFGVNSFFAFFFLYLLGPVVLLALRRKELRTTYRFPERLEVPVSYRLSGADDTAWAEGSARNLNRFGLSLTLEVGLRTDTRLDLRIRLPDREIPAGGSVRWIQAEPGRRQAHGVRFDQIGVADQDAIALYLFWEVAPKHGELLRLTARSQSAGEAA
jgi:cellulose synthase (UDP-forming)